MSKKPDEEVKEPQEKDILIEVEYVEESSHEVSNDLPDSSGKELSSYYEYYDQMYSCWRDMIDYTNVKQVPLCEYMTVYNFIDFVENV
jgi:hypothetical protein